MTKTKTTKCPSPEYTEYKPDLATRQAIERAKRDQPEMTTLSSNVPAFVKGEGWK